MCQRQMWIKVHTRRNPLSTVGVAIISKVVEGHGQKPTRNIVSPIPMANTSDDVISMTTLKSD